MQIDSTSLIAQMAYSKVKDQPAADNIDKAENFQDMVKASFNRFANMSPEQILSHINSSKITGTTSTNNVASVLVNTLSNSVKKNDETIKKSLVGEASMLDLVNTTNDARNTVQILVTVRDKMLEAFEKVMSMQI